MGEAAHDVPFLEARGLSKSFESVRACRSVDLSVRGGELHALLGENGAGKSTLVKMLYGALRPDSGTILIDGVPTGFLNPSAAQRAGVAMVFQHFTLFEALTVRENVAVAVAPHRRGGDLSERIVQLSRSYGLPLDPRMAVGDLSVGERQRIEIVRALLDEPRLLIMDEPTSVLTPQEADRLFEVLERLRSEGRAILYITHRLPEVKRMADRVTVLRQGAVAGTPDPGETSVDELARLMVGRSVTRAEKPARRGPREGRPVLALNALSQPSASLHGVALRDVSLTLRAGELLCIAGVAGNGQDELFDALSGEQPSAPAMVQIAGEPAGHWPVDRRRRSGAAFVPSDRLAHGAVRASPLSENLLLTRHRTDADLSWGPILRRSRARSKSAAVVAAFDVRGADNDPPAERLSGGNLQKFLVGRELDREPRLLIIDQPTWGVDAGAAQLIRNALIRLAGQGTAILVISQDLDEVYEIADRVAVLNAGRLSQPEPIAQIDRERIGLLMGGVHDSGQGVADAA